MPDEIQVHQQVDVDRDKIKRAVKEALDDKKMDDIAQQITELSSQMTKGFARVETRQDVANGKLMKHEVKIDNIIKTEAELTAKTSFWERNQDKVVWGFIVVGLMLFYFLLTHAGFPNFLPNN